MPFSPDSQVLVIPSHFSGDDLSWILKEPRRDIDVPIVEENPDLRLFGRGGTTSGLLLNETGGCTLALVRLFIEDAVNHERLRDPYSPDGSFSGRVARHHLRRFGRYRHR